MANVTNIDFDVVWDMAYFMFLTHGPTFFLLAHFYRVRPTTVITSLSIDVFSTTVPYMFSRFSRKTHYQQGAPSLNRGILQDHQTAMYTTVVASAILSVLLHISFSTWLPTFLVTHFEDIPDIRVTHVAPAGFPALFLSLLPAGYAVRDLLLKNPFIGLSSKPDSPKRESVGHPGGEYLVMSLYRRTWGALDAKTRILLARTLALAATIFLNTSIQVWGTVGGVDFVGAAGWGAIWAASGLVTGLVFAWIQRADET
jgi:hypothetical protein